MESPRLRPFIKIMPDHDNPGFALIWDELGLTTEPWRLSSQELNCVSMFDGIAPLHEIRDKVVRTNGNAAISIHDLQNLVARLDESLLLDGKRFRNRVDGPVREPRFVGIYPEDPDRLRRQFQHYFIGPAGPGLPQRKKPDGALKAALIPHIDFERGGVAYAWAYKELIERTEASLFIIIGTSHFSERRFTATRKHFKTPLGIARTDQAFVNRLDESFGPGLFDDELIAHVPEHSIELQVIFLQFLFENWRKFRIVPIVVGSFHDCIQNGQSPSELDEIGRIITALRAAEKETNEPVCYIISGDLAHIGPKFGDRESAKGPILGKSRMRDEKLLSVAESAQPDAIFRFVAAESDSRRICGMPPAYTALAAAQPARGRNLYYEQYAHPIGLESVSFASMAFYK